MKTFSRAEITAKRLKFIDARYRIAQFDYDDNSYDYFVLPASFFDPDCPYAVFRMIPNQFGAPLYKMDEPGEAILLGVSDQLHSQFHHLAILHEVYEHVHLPNVEGCSQAATEVELDVLNASAFMDYQKLEYVQCRREYFSALLEKARRGDSYSQSEIDDIENSLGHVEACLDEYVASCTA